jgi:hypothetical protein
MTYTTQQKALYRKTKQCFTETKKVWRLYYDEQEIPNGQSTEYALLVIKQKELINSGFYNKNKFKIK